MLVEFVEREFVDLAELPVDGMPLGTFVRNTEGVSYRLVESAEAVDHDNYESVHGCPQLRWQKATSDAGVVTPTPDSVPQSNEDGQLEAGWIPSPVAIPGYDVYVSSTGDDAADGSINFPRKTIYGAIEAALLHGGGNIHITTDCDIGGPTGNTVVGQGLWLRDDGVEAPGFLNTNNARLRFLGNGNQSGATVFGRPGAAAIYPSTGTAGDFYFTKPVIWIVGSEVPMDFDFIMSYRPPFYGFAAPVRLGWDYVRNNDGEMQNFTVSSATRAAGQTTYTISLAEAQTFTIVSAVRSANFVTATIQLSGNLRSPPWDIGTPVRIVTSDANFPSIDVALYACDAFPGLLGGTVTITYAQTGANVSGAVTGGTIVSHGFAPMDRLAFLGPNSGTEQFPPCCMMRVTAATINTVTVRDPYGYAPRSASATVAAPGFVLKQKRGATRTSAVTFNACTFFGNQDGTDQTSYGPTVDIGCVSANPIRFNDCQIDGGHNWHNWYLADPANVDYDRLMVSIFGDTGTGGAGSCTSVINNCQAQSGSIRYYGGYALSGGTNLFVNEWLTDGVHARSAVQYVEGTPYDTIQLENVVLADAGIAMPAVTLSGSLDPLRCRIGQIQGDGVPIVVSSGCVGPTNLRTGFYTTTFNTLESPWVLGWQTIWSGGLSTRHRGINRQMGVLGARVANEFPALANWQASAPFPGTVTVTQDGEAPDGSSTAIKMVSSGVSGILVGTYGDIKSSWATGGRVALGIWAKMPTTYEPFFLSLGLTGTVVFSTGDKMVLSPVINKGGWQWLTTVATITDAGNKSVALVMNVPNGTSYVWGGTMLYMGPDEVGQDVFETFMNAKHQPISLPKGMTGTMEGIKLIGHGGIGTADTYTVGGASGQVTIGATNGKAWPIRDASGTIVGWMELKSGTINP